MHQTMVPAQVGANGEVRLPERVRRTLGLSAKGGLVGFIVDGKRIRLTKATIVPEPTLSDKEVAELARLSKRGVGKKTFRTTDQALRYLWSL